MSFLKEIEKIFQSTSQAGGQSLDFQQAVEYSRDYAEFLLSELLIQNAALQSHEKSKRSSGKFEEIVSEDYLLFEDYNALFHYFVSGDAYVLREREVLFSMTYEEGCRYMQSIERLAGIYKKEVKVNLSNYLRKKRSDFFGPTDILDIFSLYIGFSVLSMEIGTYWEVYAKLNRALLHTARQCFSQLNRLSLEKEKYHNLAPARSEISKRKKRDENLYKKAWDEIPVRLRKTGSVDHLARIISEKVEHSAHSASVRTITRWINANRSILPNSQIVKME